MLIGLSGSHRTGKTTLGIEFEKSSNYKFIQVNTSQMQKEIGFDSRNQSYDFETRMKIQNHLFSCYEQMLSQHNINDDVILDRTPLDLATYAIMSVDEDVTKEQADWLNQYITKCIMLCKKHFYAILILQPAIELVECETSAKANLACMTKFNTIILGLGSLDNSLAGLLYRLPIEIKDLNHRVNVLHNIITLKNLELAVISDKVH